MMDETERAMIERKARESAALIHRVENLEADMKEVQAIKVWGFRAIGAGIIYMLVEIGKFVINAGTLPK